MVNSLRQDQPVLGGRKLYHILKTKIHPDLDIGRDKFFDLLRDNGLLIRHSRVYRPVTTLSWNRFHKYPNLIKDYDPLSANQLYVADITYVRNVEGRFYYLSLLTDAYSRKIVGWALEDSLEMSGPIKALNMALETLAPGKLSSHFAAFPTQTPGWILSHTPRNSGPYPCGNYTPEKNNSRQPRHRPVAYTAHHSIATHFPPSSPVPRPS